MLSVNYKKVVPYRIDIVLSQYFDYEHIAQVHPETLGEYRLVSSADSRAVYEQIWPRRRGRRRRRRRRSLVEHTFLPPNEMWFRFVRGLYAGVEVKTLLLEHDPGTLVDETYYLPRLRARLARPSIVRRVDRVWDEDLEVEVCHGGWPDVPAAAEGLLKRSDRPAGGVPAETSPAESPEGEWIDLGAAESLASGIGRRFSVNGCEIAVFRLGDETYALDNRCPHSGGPLAIGACDGATVICPWHGARFELATGEVIAGPAERGVATFRARRHQGRIQLLWSRESSKEQPSPAET